MCRFHQNDPRRFNELVRVVLRSVPRDEQDRRRVGEKTLHCVQPYRTVRQLNQGLNEDGVNAIAGPSL